MHPISATVLTKNAQETLKATLDTLAMFDEIVILDNGSTDATLEIAKRYSNVAIHHSPFIGFGPLHNLACDLARNDWIFSIDCDEVLSPELLQKLQTLSLDPNCIYQVNRKNFYNGRWIRGAGWYPDRKVRLFNRTSTRFTDDAVHEKVIENNLKLVPIPATIHHISYRSQEDFLSKMQHYSTLYAQSNKGKKKSSLLRAIFAAIWTFKKSYFLKWGLIDGREGLIIAIYNAQTAYYKYLKLADANQH